MNKQFFILLLSLLLPLGLAAQISINDTGSAPDSSAMLDVQSTEKGLLMPRMTSEQRDAITDPAAGLMIYNVEDSCFNYYTGEAWIVDCGRTDTRSGRVMAGIGTGSDIAYAVATDVDGNSYIGGGFRETFSFGDSTVTIPRNKNEDLFLIKVSPANEVLWLFHAGRTSSEWISGIEVDANGDVYICGEGVNSFDLGGFTIQKAPWGRMGFVAKMNSSGQVLWATSIPGPVKDLDIDAIGNSYITGCFRRSGTFGDTTINAGPSNNSRIEDLYVAKLNSSGTFEWAYSGGGNENDEGLGVCVDGAGNMYATGYIESSTATFGNGDTTLTGNGRGNPELFLVKLDPNGQLLLARELEANWAYGTDLTTDAADNLYLTGLVSGTANFGDTITTTTRSGLFLAKYSPTGQTLWVTISNIFMRGRPDYHDVVVDMAGNSYIAGVLGGTGTFAGNPVDYSDYSDIFACKYGPQGEELWARRVGSFGFEEARGLDINLQNNVHVVGSFSKTLTFGDQTLTPQNQISYDFFHWILDGTNGAEPVELSLSQLQGEPQTLSLSGTELSISGGDKVDLSSVQDNLGNHLATQSLNLDGNNLTNGDTITASTFVGDGSSLTNVRAHLATQNLELAGNWLTNDGDNEGIFIDSSGKVGIGTATPSSLLQLEDTNPKLRFVDERVQASGTGNTMGTLEWLTRDGSHTSGFTKTGKIELVNTNNSATPDARMDFVVWEDDATGRFKRTPLSLWPNGNIAVGDGTSTPNKAKLEIFGSASSYTVSGSSRYLGRGGDNLNTNYSGTFSLYADGVIGAAAFVAHSDARIKDIQGLSESETDLATLMKIEVTDYTLKDTIAKGHTPYKKVIAQQVAEVYPQAVTNTLTEVIPDIYQRAEVQEGWIMLDTDLKVGERVKLITEQRSEVHEVLAVEADRFQVSLLKTDDRELLSEAKSRKAGKTVFVYGREVTDFHTVDYEAISILNVSATQEQQKIIEQQQKMIERLLQDKFLQAQEIQVLKADKSSFEARLQALETAVNP
ncbi:MAG: tail fiber domain-containing protein [Bacteroidota bacterium]